MKNEMDDMMSSVRDISLNDFKKPQNVSPGKKMEPIEIELDSK
jgi:hypothetical protein